MNDNLLNIILVIFIIFIASNIYINSESFNLRCIISDKNGNRYCVVIETNFI